MALSLYDTSVATFLRTLTNLLGILDKAAAHAANKKFDSANYLTMRLAPDMLPFTKQIQISSDHAKRAASRLAGIEAPVFEDNEKTLDELKARTKKTIDFLKTITAAQVDGNENKPVTVPAGGGKRVWPSGKDYLFVNAMPNFYFHVTVAYAILRHAGVDIGKADFIGAQPAVTPN